MRQRGLPPSHRSTTGPNALIFSVNEPRSGRCGARSLCAVFPWYLGRIVSEKQGTMRVFPCGRSGSGSLRFTPSRPPRRSGKRTGPLAKQTDSFQELEPVVWTTGMRREAVRLEPTLIVDVAPYLPFLKTGRCQLSCWPISSAPSSDFEVRNVG